MKEQNKYDQLPSGLFDRLQRVIPLAELVANEIVSDQTETVSDQKEIFKKFVPQMYEVMHKVAKSSCEYVKRGRWSSLGLTSTDDRSEDDRWPRVPGDD